MTLVRNRAEPTGHELGKILAKWADDAEPLARLVEPRIPPRCQSCAFREGKHLANGSVATTMDALKSVMEGVPFMCHQPDRELCYCSGWLMLQLAGPPSGETREMPWPFSDEVPA